MSGARLVGWPASAAALVEEQITLEQARPPPWELEPGALIGACFLCFERGASGPGRPGDAGWAAAAAGEAAGIVTGAAGAAYEAGLLALREGPLLEAAVTALPEKPDVLVVDATGRDHPRRAGLAFHLGAVLDLPTVGVTHRPLLAHGEWPPDEPAARSPLLLGDEVVGYWVRTRRGCRPLAIHSAWRTDPETAVEVVLTCARGLRTPEPLRRARQAARSARAAAGPF